MLPKNFFPKTLYVVFALTIAVIFLGFASIAPTLAMDSDDTQKERKWAITTRSVSELCVESSFSPLIQKITVKKFSSTSSAVMLYVAGGHQDFSSQLIRKYQIDPFYCTLQCNPEFIRFNLSNADETLFKTFIEDVCASQVSMPIPCDEKKLILEYGMRFLEGQKSQSIKEDESFLKPLWPSPSPQKESLTSEERNQKTVAHFYSLVNIALKSSDYASDTDLFDYPYKNKVEDLARVVKDCARSFPTELERLLTYIHLKQKFIVSDVVEQVAKDIYRDPTSLSFLQETYQKGRKSGQF